MYSSQDVISKKYNDRINVNQMIHYWWAGAPIVGQTWQPLLISSYSHPQADPLEHSS